MRGVGEVERAVVNGEAPGRERRVGHDRLLVREEALPVQLDLEMRGGGRFGKAYEHKKTISRFWNADILPCIVHGLGNKTVS